MTVAFADFDEALAWLIRGLIEYGWTDITRSQMVTATAGPGGFNLSFVPESQGRSGVVLRMAAISGAQRCHEDDTYAFEIKLTQVQGHQGVAVRCAECNYLQEFVFDPDNPMWMAGYIHQSLVDYVPEYVRWRLGGGELTWAQRQGVPPVEGEPCSASLSGWIQQQLSLSRVFDVTMWGGGRAVARADGALASGTPIAAVGNYGSKPGSAAATVEDVLARPARALTIMVGLGGLAAAMAALNVVVTLAVFQLDRMFAVASSSVFFLLVGTGAVASFFGVRQYKQAQGTVLPWVAITYAGLVPICCFAGAPVAIWAAIRWQKPEVKAIRAAHS